MTATERPEVDLTPDERRLWDEMVRRSRVPEAWYVEDGLDPPPGSAPTEEGGWTMEQLIDDLIRSVYSGVRPAWT